MATERLARDARSLTLITPMLSMAAHVGFTLVKDQLVRLYAAGCVLEASTAFAAIEDGHVLTRHVHSGATARRRFDAVVAGVPGLPRLELIEAAHAAAAQVLVAGDAVAPRSALHAFREGDAAGRAVGRPGGGL